MSQKTYGVATLIKRLRRRSVQWVLSGHPNFAGTRLLEARELLADIDYVRDQVVTAIKSLEEQTSGHE